MDCSAYQHKSGMVTSTARRKFPAIDARHFMLLSVLRIMNDFVDSGMGHLVAGFKLITNVGHRCSF